MIAKRPQSTNQYSTKNKSFFGRKQVLKQLKLENHDMVMQLSPKHDTEMSEAISFNRAKSLSKLQST